MLRKSSVSEELVKAGCDFCDGMWGREEGKACPLVGGEKMGGRGGGVPCPLSVFQKGRRVGELSQSEVIEKNRKGMCFRGMIN